MMWVFAILIVLVLGGVALVASGVGSPMGEEYGDRPDVAVPADRPLGAADLRRVRFSVTLRGYRMSEVDALLARLAADAERRDGDSLATPRGPDDERDPDDAETRPAGDADGEVAPD